MIIAEVAKWNWEHQIPGLSPVGFIPWLEATREFMSSGVSEHRPRNGNIWLLPPQVQSTPTQSTLWYIRPGSTRQLILICLEMWEYGCTSSIAKEGAPRMKVWVDLCVWQLQRRSVIDIPAPVQDVRSPRTSQPPALVSSYRSHITRENDYSTLALSLSLSLRQRQWLLIMLGLAQDLQPLNPLQLSNPWRTFLASKPCFPSFQTLLVWYFPCWTDAWFVASLRLHIFRQLKSSPRVISCINRFAEQDLVRPFRYLIHLSYCSSCRYPDIKYGFKTSQCSRSARLMPILGNHLFEGRWKAPVYRNRNSW